MCGIHLEFRQQDQLQQNPSSSSSDDCCKYCQEAFSSSTNNHKHNLLYRRGPDSQHSVSIEVPSSVVDDGGTNNDNGDGTGGNSNNSTTTSGGSSSSVNIIQLHASVLQMRKELIQQPVQICDDDDDVYLCWNGELYQTLDNDQVWDYDISDTILVANRLKEYCNKSLSLFDEENDDDHDNNNNDNKKKISSYQKQQNQQRQMLLSSSIIADIMSTFYNSEFAFVIVTPTKVYYGRDCWGRRSLLRWDCPSPTCGSFQIVSTAETILQQQQQQQQSNDDNEGNNVASTTTSNGWTEILPGQVHESSFVITGGNCNTNTTSTPILSSISPSSQHRREMIFEVMSKLYAASSSSDTNTNIIRQPPDDIPNELWEASLTLEYHLDRAIQMRMTSSSQEEENHESTGVLFSGGLDSAVVAAIAARHCYEQNKTNNNNKKHVLFLYNVSFGDDDYGKSADRKAALITYEVLKAKYGDIVIFKDIIVSWETLSKWEQHIRTLLQPKSTLMDINIAAALWFASSGGILMEGDDNDENKNDDNNNEHHPHPRVLLLGMGADEQMGGYGRHRKAYERGGFDELQKELQLDQDRFWERNLGRDDRICADHSKEARFPFLDPHVTTFLRQEIPLNLICDFTLPPGQGDKRILRLVAQRLGLDHASGLVKRAIQFGSRISHLSDAKRFGSRRKAKGQASIGT